MALNRRPGGDLPPRKAEQAADFTDDGPWRIDTGSLAVDRVRHQGPPPMWDGQTVPMPAPFLAPSRLSSGKSSRTQSGIRVNTLVARGGHPTPDTSTVLEPISDGLTRHERRELIMIVFTIIIVACEFAYLLQMFSRHH